MERRLLSAPLILLFLTTSLLAQPEPVMRAHYINVGQGASTLLEFPCGAILIDTGGQDSDSVDHLADYLRDFFSRRTDLDNTLNALVISHPHLDHTRGIRRVFETCRVRTYIDDGIVAGSGRAGVRFAREHAMENATTVREIHDADVVAVQPPIGLTDAQIDSIQCPDCDPLIRILSGAIDDNPGWEHGEFDNLNNHSLVLRVDFGESSFLFTGDLETPAIETLVDYYDGTDMLDVDVYLVGHHGSHNGTTQSLVDAMTPDVAVFGVGESTFGQGRPRGFNTFSYGHPRRTIVEMLSAAIPGRRSRAIDVDVADGARDFSSFHLTRRLYATAWDGDVTITSKLDGSMRVTTAIIAESPLLAVGPGAAAPARAMPADAAADDIDSLAPYAWNATIPEKRPDDGGNGKVVLFDVSHGGTAGQSDWVIDGGFSDFADALVDAGYTVREYRGVDKDGDGIVRFFDDRRHELAEQNEAIIDFGAIRDTAVFVMAETNRPLRKDERAALLQYVESGKGLFLIADHYNADRNLNTWDATEVFNGYNRSTAPQFDLGGLYGDWRNPGDASVGWLAENFGLRFRFNAINCFSGASDIVEPAAAEQITEGVTPVLMAAGATLAIVDPSKAKGLVYLADSDGARSWSKAVEGRDGGLYFGGRNEGPYVAIAKPNFGKAAFIGDSSPIEDISPKYSNERNGGQKNLHNGWNDPGNAATLAVRIIDWLATPEPYVGFDASNGHALGTATLEPMAPPEREDPDDGRPWSNPGPAYDPWDTDTFAPGSYGAPFPQDSPGGGTPSTGVLSVAEALAAPEGGIITVQGVIQREHNDQFGLKLGDTLTAAAFLAVQVPRDLREQFNPKLNPSATGQKVKITGKRGQYTSLPGLRSVSSIVTLNDP